MKRIKALFEAFPDARLTGAQIAQITGLWAVYVHLMRLEDAGYLVSEFEEGPYPRRRFYSRGKT